MNISPTPTGHILIKAHTCSDWDDCDFAVIACDTAWQERMASRLEATGCFHPGEGFLSFRYVDHGAEFYISPGEEFPDGLPEDDRPVFVEFETGERESFQTPVTGMDDGRIVIYRDGSAMYVKHGKYTADEFFTECFSLPDILERCAAERKPLTER